MEAFGKMLVFIGAVILTLGLFVWGLSKIPGIGRLPGDILIKRDNVVFYFPLMTSVLLSVVLSLLFTLFRR